MWQAEHRMPAASTYFRATWDRTTLVITVLVCLLLVIVAVLSQSLLVTVLTTAIVGVAYAYSPTGYEVHGTDVVVRRPIGSVRLGPVQSAREASIDDLRFAFRLWGSGGLFGHFGLYRTSALGKCWWYVTNRRKSVVLQTPTTVAVISPEDVAGLLAALDAPSESNAQLRPTVGKAGTYAGVAIGGIALAVTAAALLYSPGSPSYSLTDGALQIHDRFYPVTIGARDVDVNAIRVIDINGDVAWQPTARVNGFANPRYKSGWFRVRNGARVRLYRTDQTRLVLLPPKGDHAPVLLEVERPDDFAAQLRDAWRQ